MPICRPPLVVRLHLPSFSSGVVWDPTLISLTQEKTPGKRGKEVLALSRLPLHPGAPHICSPRPEPFRMNPFVIPPFRGSSSSCPGKRRDDTPTTPPRRCPRQSSLAPAPGLVPASGRLDPFPTPAPLYVCSVCPSVRLCCFVVGSRPSNQAPFRPSLFFASSVAIHFPSLYLTRPKDKASKSEGASRNRKSKKRNQKTGA
jgi:hypothetical protein